MRAHITSQHHAHRCFQNRFYSHIMTAFLPGSILATPVLLAALNGANSETTAVEV